MSKSSARKSNGLSYIKALLLTKKDKRRKKTIKPLILQNVAYGTLCAVIIDKLMDEVKKGGSR
jgi:hypothetical protein